MTTPRRLAKVVGRGLGRLVSPERREWLEAIWAEGAEVSPGLQRLAWRAGGLCGIAKEVLGGRRLAHALVYLAGSVTLIWEVRHGAPSVVSRAAYRSDVLPVMLEAVGLLLGVRLLLGSVSESWTARLVRTGACCALLALIPAREAVRLFSFQLPRGGVTQLLHRLIDPARGKAALLEPVLFVLITVYGVAFLWMTSRRSRVVPATLTIGTCAGLVLGVVMYSIAPLGLSANATNPWLPGHDVDPLLIAAWILVLFGPMGAAGLASHRYTRSTVPPPSASNRIRQVVAALLSAYLVGSLFVMVLSTGTISIMIRSSWLRSWLYHGRHLFFGVGGLRSVVQGNPGAIAYGHEITGAVDQGGLFVIGLGFFLLACMATLLAAASMRADAPDEPPRDGGGPPRPQPAPEPSGGQPLDEFTDDASSPLILVHLEELDPGHEDGRVLVSARR